MFDIRINDRELKRLQKALKHIPNALPRVMSRGLNRTAGKSRTELARSAAKVTGLKIGAVRKRIKIVKATYRRWSATVTLKDRAIPLIEMRARQTKKGVTYREIGTKKRVLLSSGFIATMPSGHRGVFLRRGTASTPIDEQYGPRLSEIYSSEPEELNRIRAESAAKLAKNIADQVELVLKRRSG